AAAEQVMSKRWLEPGRCTPAAWAAKPITPKRGAGISWQPTGASAEFGLGVLHANGYGVEIDLPAAARWYEKAAAKGYADAQLALGLMCAPREPAWSAIPSAP